MTPTTLAACWALVALTRLGPRLAARPTPPRRGPGVHAAIGSRLRASRLLGWATALDARDDRSLGALVLTAAAMAPLQPVVGLLLLLAGTMAVVGSARRRMATAPAGPLELASVVDLLVVATTAGLGPTASIESLTGRVDPPFDDSGLRARSMLRAGSDTDTALAALFEPAGEPGRGVAVAIRDARRDGVALAAVLSRASADLDLLGTRQAEQRARRLPVQLILPLVTCILPAFVLLTVVPLLAGSIGSLPF